ncbi:MAG: sigma-70 family RNA polymerase sigma factor, partial [Eubacteriales bacterium]
MMLRRAYEKLINSDGRGFFYINGPDVLPPPLDHEEENRVIMRMEEDEDARLILVEHNLRLVVYIAKKFENTGVGIEDLISIGTIGLIKAINTFKADKNIKLATYASRCIENEILMYIRKRSNARCEMSIDEPLNVDWDGNELLLSDTLGNDDDNIVYEVEAAEERKMIREAVSHLSERERVIIEMRYGLGGS